MDNKTHQPPDEERDDFCRELVKAAQASEQEINAAANAPFLYSQLLARIAAEQDLRFTAFGEREKQPRRKFNFFSNWAWQGCWAMAATAVALMALTGWYRLHSFAPAPMFAPTIARQQLNPLAATALPLPSNQDSLPPPQTAKNKRAVKPSIAALATSRRAMPANSEENGEIATDYLPLTYVADGDEQSGQVVRVEMPRSAMLALGLPVNNESTGAMVKADVIVGDDGLALAIRFVR